MIYEVADIISTEARAFSKGGRAGLDYWTPNVNPYRDPRWRRGSETPEEDPRRIKGYAKHFLRGLEGNESSVVKVLATQALPQDMTWKHGEQSNAQCRSQQRGQQRTRA